MLIPSTADRSTSAFVHELPPGLQSVTRAVSATLFSQFVLYAMVGGLAFTIDFGTLYLLTEHSHLDYMLAAPIAFLLGLLVSYLLCTRWVFSKRKVQNVAAEFAIFAAIGMAGLGLNESIQWFLSDRMAVPYMQSKAASAAIVLLWNFTARRLALFQ